MLNKYSPNPRDTRKLYGWFKSALTHAPLSAFQGQPPLIFNIVMCSDFACRDPHNITHLYPRPQMQCISGSLIPTSSAADASKQIIERKDDFQHNGCCIIEFSTNQNRSWEGFLFIEAMRKHQWKDYDKMHEGRWATSHYSKIHRKEKSQIRFLIFQLVYQHSHDIC